MKRSPIYTLIALAVLLSAFSAISTTLAQPDALPLPPGGHHPNHGGPMPPPDLSKDLKEKLNLTDDQSAKVKRIFDDQHKQVKGILDSLEEVRTALTNKIEQLQKESNDKISALLNDEQKKKFEEMLKKRPRHCERPPEP